VPLIGAEKFRIGSTTLVVSSIVSFGVVKACANLISGQLADAWGRKRVLVLSWLVGLPVPFMIIWAPSWEWVIAANALLGINQGLAWSMTVIMKIDLVGPKSRGLAVGLNEFAGNLAVGVTAYLTGYLASEYGLRPAQSYLGVAYAIIGSAFSILLVHDTREHVRLETAGHARQAAPISFREIFLLTSFRDRNLFAACQAGLVNNLNDGMSWGIFPLFFASFGLAVERIGLLKAVYPATWGILQVATGPLSDRWGRKGLIVAGMWVQAAGLFLTGATTHFEWWLVGQPAPRNWHGHGLPEPDRRCLRRITSELAGPLAQRLPLLARPRLRDRGAVGRHHRRQIRAFSGDRIDRRPDVHFRRRRCGVHARMCGGFG
jgi:MFS family permease